MLMPTQFVSGLRQRPFAPAALVLAVYLLLQTAGGILAAPPADRPIARAEPASVLASGWGLSRLWHKGEVFLSDRRRMIQLATLGMCIGIYIMMRSGKWR